MTMTIRMNGIAVLEISQFIEISQFVEISEGHPETCLMIILHCSRFEILSETREAVAGFAAQTIRSALPEYYFIGFISIH
jgi:hypothetical protein